MAGQWLSQCLFCFCRGKTCAASLNTMACQKVITFDNMNGQVKTMEYAVRGPLVIRATAIEKELQKVSHNYREEKKKLRRILKLFCYTFHYSILLFYYCYSFMISQCCHFIVISQCCHFFFFFFSFVSQRCYSFIVSVVIPL